MRHVHVWFFLAVLQMPAAATTYMIDATNPGPIEGSGRTLVFDLDSVSGEIRSARLDIDIDFSVARDLTLLLDSNGQQLPLAAFSAPGGTKALRGRYGFSDAAVTTWVQLEAAAGAVLDAKAPAHAYQLLRGAQCLNLIGRYLEFDIDRSEPLQLRIERFSGSTGAGAISAARLTIDTDMPDRIAEAGFDEPSIPIVRCRRPANNLLINGMSDDGGQSSIALIDFGSANLAWFLRQRSPPLDVGPIAFGGGNDEVYVGRFGGRSRLNFGVFDANTGSLSFTAGTGARTVSIVGDWLATSYRTMPGDYDGDGVTDLALAFLDGGSNRWTARIRFSSTEVTRDYPIDPRSFDPVAFSSGAIGWGAGQDSDLDGRDEIVGYAEFVSGGAMSYLQFVPNPENGGIGGFRTGSFGQRGHRLVLGQWQTGSANAMRVYVAAGALQWQQFGSPTAIAFGLPNDLPLSIHIDGDALNDIAVYRPGSGEIYALQSSTGTTVILPALTAPGLGIVPLAFLQGVTAPLEQ